jgi:hypothetical protein
MEDMSMRRGECEEVDDEMISAWLISTAEIHSCFGGGKYTDFFSAKFLSDFLDCADLKQMTC